MKAAYLIKHGDAQDAFEIREVENPVPDKNQVLIQVEAFGINFADVMARLGLYRDAPDLPSILGYDVVGRIAAVGDEVNQFKVGDRVTALTRFGGYAEFALAEDTAAYEIPESFSPGVATALSTQYTTAYFLAHNMANLQKDDRVLIHAAAGGVGTALVQIAKFRGCEIFGTCSSEKKIQYLKESGVDHPINYAESDFVKAVEMIVGKRGLDVIFDPRGGKSLHQGYKLLGAGGRLVSYGVSSMNQARSIFGKIRVLIQFGLYHPVQLLSGAKGIIGVNMLKIGESNPNKVSNAMQKVIELTEQGILHPHVGGEFPIEELAQAHQFLESRKSMGKIVVKWPINQKIL